MSKSTNMIHNIHTYVAKEKKRPNNNIMYKTKEMNHTIV